MEPSFYAIIPATVRYHQDLNANAKLLYGEITALCNQEGYCWANNNYFSKLYGVTPISISTWISNLQKYGFIRIDPGKQLGNKRKIYMTLLKETLIPIKENFNTPIKENFNHNNTKNNITTKSSSLGKEEDKRPGVASSLFMKWEYVLRKLEELFGLKLPLEDDSLLKGENIIPVNKTVLKVIETLERLRNGKFAGDTSFTEFDVASKKSTNETVTLVMKALRLYEKALLPQHWPDNKEPLKKLNALSFFLSYKTKFSYMLYLLRHENEIEGLVKEEFKELDGVYPSRIVDRVYTMFGKTEKTNKALRFIWNKCVEIVGQSRYQQEPNFTYLSTETAIIHKFLDFVSEFPNPNYGLLTSDPTWRLFENFIFKKYGLTFYPKSKLVVESFTRLTIYQYILFNRVGAIPKSKAEEEWKRIKNLWIKEYGDYEWYDTETKEHGGTIDDEQGVWRIYS